MTFDELREKIKEICAENSIEVFHVKAKGRDQLYALLQEHRNEVFQMSQRLPEHWEVEKEIKEQDPELYAYLRSERAMFTTCSCGSREDSCTEDEEGNFSRFIFTEDGRVFRSVEKKL